MVSNPPTTYSMDADAFTGKSSDWERWSNALELHIKTRGGALLWDAITGAAITSTTYDEADEEEQQDIIKQLKNAHKQIKDLGVPNLSTDEAFNELYNDDEAVITILQRIQVLGLNYLVANTSGTAGEKVKTIRPGGDCARDAFHELSTFREDDIEDIDKLLQRLQQGKTFGPDDQPRRMAAHDNVNDHATNIVRLSNRLKNQAEQLPDDNGMRPVFLAQTTEAAKHHILRHNIPQQYETTVKSVYDERPTEQKSFTKLTAYLSRTQRDLIKAKVLPPISYTKGKPADVASTLAVEGQVCWDCGMPGHQRGDAQCATPGAMSAMPEPLKKKILSSGKGRVKPTDRRTARQQHGRKKKKQQSQKKRNFENYAANVDCRDGASCTRRDCAFRHPGDAPKTNEGDAPITLNQLKRMCESNARKKARTEDHADVYSMLGLTQNITVFPDTLTIPELLGYTQSCTEVSSIDDAGYRVKYIGLDSNTTFTVSDDKSHFLSLKPLEQPIKVMGAGKKVTHITHHGPFVVASRQTKTGKVAAVVDVNGLYSCDIGVTVIAATKLSKHGLHMHIGGINGKPLGNIEAALVAGQSQQKLWLHEKNGIIVLQILDLAADAIELDREAARCIQLNQQPQYPRLLEARCPTLQLANRAQVTQTINKVSDQTITNTPDLTQSRAMQPPPETTEQSGSHATTHDGLLLHFLQNYGCSDSAITLINEAKLQPAQRSRLWLRRFAHPSIREMKRITANDIIKGVDVKHDLADDDFAEKYQGKLRFKPHRRKDEALKRRGYLKPMHVQHVDVKGPYRVPSVHGARYFALFVCEFTGAWTFYPYKNKSQFAAALDKHAKWCHAQCMPLRIMRSDNAPDLISGDAELVMNEWNIVSETTPANTPSSGGMHEKAIGDCSRTIDVMMNTSPWTPDSTWALAGDYAAFVHNVLPPSRGSKSRFELLHGRVPDANDMTIRVWGCPVLFGYTKQQRMAGLTDAQRRHCNQGFFMGVRGASVIVLDSDNKLRDVSRNKVVFLESPYVNPRIDTSAAVNSGLNNETATESAAAEIDPQPEIEIDLQSETGPTGTDTGTGTGTNPKATDTHPNLLEVERSKTHDCPLDYATDDDGSALTSRGAVSKHQKVPDWHSHVNEGERLELQAQQAQRRHEERQQKAEEKTREQEAKRQSILRRYKDIEISNLDEDDSTVGRVVDAFLQNYGKSNRQGWKVSVEWDNNPNDKTEYWELPFRKLQFSGESVDKKRIIDAEERLTSSNKRPRREVTSKPEGFYAMSIIKYAKHPSWPKPIMSHDMLRTMRTLPEPKNSWQCLMQPDWIGWLHSMWNENQSWKELDVYETVSRAKVPRGSKIFPLAEVYKRKWHAHQAFDKHKCRLVVWGHLMEKGKHFFNTFAPTVSATTTRLFLAIAAAAKVTPASLDIRTAYLHARMDDRSIYAHRPIYARLLDKSWEQIDSLRSKAMKLPPAELQKLGKMKYDPQDPYVWRLKAFAYGHPEAAAAWHATFAKVMKTIGMKQSKVDPCLWFKVDHGLKVNDAVDVGEHGYKGSFILAIAWVDDVPFCTNNKLWHKEFVDEISKHLPIELESKITQFLGLEVDVKDNGAIELTAKGLIKKTQKRFEQEIEEYCKKRRNAKHARTPYADQALLKAATDEEFREAKHLPFAQITGVLSYVANWVKLEMQTIVNMLSRYMSKYSRSHFEAALHALIYAGNTSGRGVLYSPNTTFYGNNVLYGFADADLGSDESRRSRAGTIAMFNGAAISAKSRLKLVQVDTASAEITAANTSAMEIKGIRNILQEIGLCQTKPTVIFEDNQACITIANNAGSLQSRTKHLDLKVYKIRELIQQGDVVLQYCITQRQVADILTKLLPPTQFRVLSDRLCGYWVMWEDGIPPL